MKSTKALFISVGDQIEKQYPLKRDVLTIFLRERHNNWGLYSSFALLSYYRTDHKISKRGFPQAEALYSKVLSLPMFPFMTEQEFGKVFLP